MTSQLPQRSLQQPWHEAGGTLAVRSPAPSFVVAALLALVAWFIAFPASDVRGCGADAALGDGFGTSHPQAMTVAFGVRDAVHAGLLDQRALTTEPGKTICERAAPPLHSLQRRLSSAVAVTGDPAKPISILLIDTSYWARLTPTSRGLDAALHTTPTESDDPIIVTHQAVLEAIVDRRLSVETALTRKLLIVDGEKASAPHVTRLLLQLR